MRRLSLSSSIFFTTGLSFEQQLRCKATAKKPDLTPQTLNRDLLRHREKKEYKSSWDHHTSKDVNESFIKARNPAKKGRKRVATGFNSVDQERDAWKEDWPHEDKNLSEAKVPKIKKGIVK
eukprot:GILI01022139.1.p1 GENE.GILI01022139.1~~GILI01022139.1.p1  ORF type:complete len:121 (-),score=18.54 GILI01022139.1:105-467(-)